MRLYCFECGKPVSNEIPEGTIFRGIAQCPECIDKHSPDPSADIEPCHYLGMSPSVTQYNSLIYGWLVSWDRNGERHSFDGETRHEVIVKWNTFIKGLKKEGQ